DSHDQIYEFNTSGHVDAEQNNTSQTTLGISRDLQVANLAVTPVSPLSGTNITITWNDANSGDRATEGSWNDRIVITNSTTSTTLLDTTILYDANAAGDIAPGNAHSQQYVFRLPDGDPGVGNLQFTVTANSSHALLEYNSAATATTNNSAATPITASIAPY